MRYESEENAEFIESLKDFHEAKEQNDREASEEALARVWEAMEEESEPSPWLLAMARAHECEARFDWLGAEEGYRIAVAADDNLALKSMALNSLCVFLNFLEQEERALSVATESVALARRIESPMFRAQGLRSALRTEGALRFQRGQLGTARELLNEELEILRVNERMSDILLPDALTRRAMLNFKSGDLDAAKRDLNEAWLMLETRREWTFMTSSQGNLASWWTTQAKLCAAQNDREGQIAALREAVQAREVVSHAPQLEGPFKFNSLARAWFDLAQALQNVEPNQAEDALIKSAAIRESIGLAAFD